MEIEELKQNINWYLPVLEGSEYKKIPVAKDEKYTASLISDFYYVEGLKNIWEENYCSEKKSNDFYESNIELIERLDSLDEIHKGYILMKRFFLHGLVTIQNYANKAPKADNDDKKTKLKNLFDSCLRKCRDILKSYFETSEFAISGLNRAFENILEEFKFLFGLDLYFPFVSFTKKFYDALFKGLDREDLYFFLRIWILLFGLFSCDSLDDFDAFQAILLRNFISDDYTDGLAFVDRNLGNKQKDCCLFMLQSSLPIEKIIKDNYRIKVIVNLILSNEKLKEIYSSGKRGCYSCLWLGSGMKTYYALSGSEGKEKSKGKTLQSLIPQNMFYEQVGLNDNVKFYPDESKFVFYGDAKKYIKNNKKDKIIECFACCEIKIIAKIEELNDTVSEHHIFIKYFPCGHCGYALKAVENHPFKLNVVSPPKNKEKKQDKIKFLNKMKPTEIHHISKL